MARPRKTGMDYFPVDTKWDIKMQLVKAKYGLEGIGCVIELFKLIYSEGYFIKWDDDTQLMFSSDNHIDENKLSEMIGFLALKGVFHAGKLDKLRVLTSRGIQKRWVQVAKDSNRAVRDIDNDMDLLTDSELQEQKTEFPAQETRLPAQENPHIILDYIKEKNIREEEPVFSLSDELNPNKKTAIGRIEEIRNYWNNAGAMPPCRKIITNPHPDKYQSIFATLASYTDSDIQGAINNYVSITKSTTHEAFPHYGGVEGFIATGVEQYCDESEPFKRCLKKQAKAPDKPMSVEVPDSGETREFLDNLRTSTRDESFEFNAKDAMRQIRERSEA
jgi:hypothetical protein